LPEVGQERLHEMWEQAESFGDHWRSARQPQQVFDDQLEALTLEPGEGVEHLLWGAVEPALVHGHGLEARQVGRLIRGQGLGVTAHGVIRRVGLQAVLAGEALGNGRLPGSAAAADPEDVFQPTRHVRSLTRLTPPGQRILSAEKADRRRPPS